MRIYIAAPFFNERQLEIVKSLEGWLDYLGIDYFSPRSQGKPLKDMSGKELLKARGEVFQNNVDNMEACSHMIACVEEKDTGTSFEIGYFFKSGKPIIMYSEKIGRINVMLAEAAFSICDDPFKLSAAINGRYSITINELI